MNKLLTATAAIAIAFATPACATDTVSADPVAETAAATAAPAMWKLADDDTTIYILGTFHLLPADHEWRDERIDVAIAEASELVLETDIDPSDPMAIAPLIQELGLTPGQAPILDRVPEDKRDALTAAMQETGMPAAMFDMMDSWFAGFTLIGVQIQKAGLTADAGVEHDLRTAFLAAGKSIGELETPREQLSYMDNLSQEAQNKLLVDALDDSGEMVEMLNEMLAAWTAGDIDAIAATFNEDYADSEEMMQALLYTRNAKWVDKLEARLAEPGTILVAVGAGHLAGEDSVIDMLEDEGLAVTRVR